MPRLAGAAVFQNCAGWWKGAVPEKWRPRMRLKKSIYFYLFFEGGKLKSEWFKILGRQIIHPGKNLGSVVQCTMIRQRFCFGHDLFSGFTLFLFWKCVRFCFYLFFCCCMHLYFMFTAVSYQMFFHWYSFMYPHWGFRNKPLDLIWQPEQTTLLFGRASCSVTSHCGPPIDGCAPDSNPFFTDLIFTACCLWHSFMCTSPCAL